MDNVLTLCADFRHIFPLSNKCYNYNTIFCKTENSEVDEIQLDEASKIAWNIVQQGSQKTFNMWAPCCQRDPQKIEKDEKTYSLKSISWKNPDKK